MNLQKQADPSNYSYDPTTKTFLTSALAGAGVFGTGMLAKHVMGMKPKAKNDDDALKDSIPIRVPKAQEKTAIHPDLLKALAVAGGGVGGFIGAKGLYDAYNNHALKSELDATKKKYDAALDSTKVAIDTDTPLVDIFCEGIAKHAHWYGHTSEENGALFGGPLENAMKAVKGVARMGTGGAGGAADTYGLALQLAALTGGAGMFGALNNMNDKKREANKTIESPNVYIQQ